MLVYEGPIVQVMMRTEGLFFLLYNRWFHYGSFQINFFLFRNILTPLEQHIKIILLEVFNKYIYICHYQRQPGVFNLGPLHLQASDTPIPLQGRPVRLLTKKNQHLTIRHCSSLVVSHCIYICIQTFRAVSPASNSSPTAACWA